MFDWIATAHAAGEVVTEAKLAAVGWLTWAWVLALSSLGGVVGFYQKLKTGRARPFNFAELIGEIAGSALVGIVTFLLCKEAGFSEYLTAAFVAITGHMGTRAMMFFERVLESRITPGH